MMDACDCPAFPSGRFKPCLDRALAGRIYGWRISTGAGAVYSRAGVNKAAVGLLMALRAKGWVREELFGPEPEEGQEGQIAAVGLSERVWLCCARRPFMENMAVRLAPVFADGVPVMGEGEEQALEALFSPEKWIEIALAAKSEREREELDGKALSGSKEPGSGSQKGL